MVEAKFLHHPDPLMCRNLPLILTITLVTDQVAQNTIEACIVLYFPLPFFDMGETIPTSDIEYEHYNVGVLIEDSSDRSELLFTCGVPDLKLNQGCIIDDHREIVKFNSDSHNVLICKTLLCKPGKQT